jgi:hypothetical protein
LEGICPPRESDPGFRTIQDYPKDLREILRQVAVVPPREPDGEPMIESIAVEYRAQAARYDALAKQAPCAARENLYRRLARGYLTLADLASPPEAIGAGGNASELLKDFPAGLR